MPTLYHYTSRGNAQMVSKMGELLPGASGGVYATPDLYDTGADALDRLAIPRTTPEMVFVWFAEYTDMALDEGDISDVEPLRSEGRLIRRGGGAEIHIPGRVDVSHARILSLRSP